MFGFSHAQGCHVTSMPLSHPFVNMVALVFGELLKNEVGVSLISQPMREVAVMVNLR